MGQVTDFDLCSFSKGLGSLNGAALKCDNYGAFFCKICARYWCDEHKCLHLLSNSEEASEGLLSQQAESNLWHSDDKSMGLCYLDSSGLRSLRDKLFSELKAVQAELDLRENSAEAIAREFSIEANLNSWLTERGYEKYKNYSRRSNHTGSSRRNNRRGISNISSRSNHNPQSYTKTIEASIKTLFKGMSEEQIKVFIKKARKEI
ncbi:MAG TPA: hypothetical protein VGF75_08220 [Candidatus Saccharimonadales bacterium]|jgi:hypothetical protein